MEPDVRISRSLFEEQEQCGERKLMLYFHFCEVVGAYTLITSVCKWDGEYYFRYVSTSISRSRKAKDYEHTPSPALVTTERRRLVQAD